MVSWKFDGEAFLPILREELERAEILAKRLAPVRGWDLWGDSDLSAGRLARIERMPRQRLGCGLTLAGIPNEESVHVIDDIPHVRCDCGDLHRLAGDVLAGFLARVVGAAEAEARHQVAEWARQRRAEEEREAGALRQMVGVVEQELQRRADATEAKRQAQAEHDRLDPAKIALELYADYPVGDLPTLPETVPLRRRLHDVDWLAVAVFSTVWTVPFLLSIGLIVEVAQGNWSSWMLLWIPAGGFVWYSTVGSDG